jgi:L-lysine 6-transaminase
MVCAFSFCGYHLQASRFFSNLWCTQNYCMNKNSSVRPEQVHGTLRKHLLADGYDIVMDLHRSRGSWLADELSGRLYLDMFSMYGSMAIGYNHPHIVASTDILGELSIQKPSVSDIYTTYQAEFLDTFSRVGIPDYLPNAFFIDGGALAVENALKVAFDWKVRKNLAKGKGQKGTQIIHFKNAFHGRSGYTLSITNTADPRKYQYFPLFPWPRITSPALRFPDTQEHLEQTLQMERQAISEIVRAIAQFPDDIAAIIIEPIQAEGGDRHFRPEFLKALRDICLENELLLIFDEVQTGVCLTGMFWAHQHHDIRPDVMAFGKKTQVCGILAGPRVQEVERNVFKESSRINSTFGGHLVDMHRFRLILEVIERDHLEAHAAEMGQYLLSKLRYMEQEWPSVTQTRGLGLMCAFDLPSAESKQNLIQECRKEGLLILGCGTQSIRFRPHLNVQKQEIDLAMDIIKKCLPKV